MVKKKRLARCKQTEPQMDNAEWSRRAVARMLSKLLALLARNIRL